MASVRFRQNRPKDQSGNEKTKPVTILCEYYHKGIQVEKATIIKCLPSRWRNGRIKNDGTSNQYLTELEKTLLSFPINNPQLTVEEHRQAVASIIKGFKPNAETSQKKTLFTALDNFLNQYKSEKERKTLFKYQALKTRLTDFDKIYPIDFDNLAVWGTLKGIHAAKDVLGFTVNASHANFYVEIGNTAIAGCQALYCVRCDNPPIYEKVGHSMYSTEKGYVEIERSNEIYISE